MTSLVSLNIFEIKLDSNCWCAILVSHCNRLHLVPHYINHLRLSLTTHPLTDESGYERSSERHWPAIRAGCGYPKVTCCGW
jgi:hypothetical protein